MPQEPNRPPVSSGAKVRAFHLLDQSVSVGEVRLFAMVDGAACLIDRGQLHSARLLLEVAAPELAGRAIRVLTGEEA